MIETNEHTGSDPDVIEYYSLSFPDRPIKRVNNDLMGYEIDFGTPDQEIVDWCTKAFGPAELWGETHETWKYMGPVFYFSKESLRTACILAWE